MLRFATILVAVFALSACETPDRISLDPYINFDVADEDDQFSDYQDLYTGGLATIATEMAADRVFRESPLDAAETLGFILNTQSSLAQIRGVKGLWMYADRFDVIRSLIVVSKKRILSRVKDTLLTGLNFRSALKATSQGAKGVAMLRDVKTMIEQVRVGTLTQDEMWNAITMRIQGNRDRIESLMGLSP